MLVKLSNGSYVNPTFIEYIDKPTTPDDEWSVWFNSENSGVQGISEEDKNLLVSLMSPPMETYIDTDGVIRRGVVYV
jgi:hypothetical protein